MHLLRRSCRVEGRNGPRGIINNLADPGQSSRPLPPIQTLLEDKEDGEDYSEVIEVLKQHIKSHKRVIASQSSDIKTLLLSLNTLKASIKESVSAIKNISSTLASLTNSSNAAATGKTSYSPRFNPFSGTIDLDSPPRPPRKEPHLGPAIDNTATSNLDPPIDIGSKEGFKDTITSSIVKELSKKAYIIPDDKESRNPAIEAYRAAYMANSSNSTPNSNSNPSKKGKNKKKASFILGSYNLAIEEEEESDSSSNSRYKKRKDFKGKGLKTSSNNKAKYKDNQPRRRPRNPALYNSQLRPINTGNGPVSPASIGSIILEVLSRKAPPTYTKLVLDNVLYLPNIDINIISRVRHYDSGGCLIKETLYGGDRCYIAVLDFKKSGFFLNVKGSSKPILHANFAFPLGLSSYTTKSIEPQRDKIVVEIPSNSIRKEDYRPIIEDAIISEDIEPNKRYKLWNSPAKGTTLEEGNKVVEKAISSPTLKEPNIGQLGHIGLRLLKKTSSITKGLPNFIKIKEADFHCSSYNRGKAVRRVSKALIPDPPRVLDSIEGDTVKIRPRRYNRNPIVLLLVDRKSRYRWVFNLPNKSGPIVANAIKGFFRGLRNGFGRYPTKFHFDGGTETTDLLTTWSAKRGIKFSTSTPYIHEQNGLVERLVSVTAITNKETTPFQALFDELEPGIPYIPNLERYRAIGAKGEAIIPLEKRSKSLKFTSRTEECKLLAVLGSKTYLVYIPSRRAVLKTSTIKFIEDNIVLSQPTDNMALEGELVDLDLDLEGAVSPDPSNLNTEKPISMEIGPSKLESYKSSSDKPIFAPKPIEVIAPNQPITNEPLNNSDLILEGDKMQLDYYKLLAKTSSYILGYSSSRVSGRSSSGSSSSSSSKYLNSTKDYSICFSYNGNTVADLGPKLSNSSNTTTKLSRDFYSKEGPRPLTTTSTTIVDSRNSKGSSRTSIINSSLVPIGFSNSDFTGDKATSKSTYGYLYKLAGRPINWKTKRATTIALSTLEAETDGLTEASGEVQWIIGLFSKLHRPIDYPITLYRDNQGSITVANDPALHARTKHTLLKFLSVREQVNAKIVTIIYLNTKFNSTGYFTAL
ncbi:hypothetical protein P8C59_007106 [Phyllachora maydis]|uniref:Integrase catalytic domain-containing protein n=1 Tax=Phyllachora maydis TaxID=1825666 RepID=A0AAD9I7S0_9PEZI|nr:hypothetical protein P8C59_007106 [Phyllachora maydis]